MGAIQFIHISDVNIGRKSDKLLFGQTGEKDGITTLKQVVSDAGKLQADFVFITGDLFDHPATEEDLAWIDEIFLPLDKTAVIYCQGDHDYMKSDSALTGYSFRSNIYVAGCSEYRNPVPAGSAIYGVKHENATAMIDVIRFPKKNAVLYCAGYYSAGAQMAVLDELTPADDEMTNILLAHAGNHGAIPIDYPTIRKAGFDYIGLGHEASYKNMYNGRICYPGVLEPDNNRETGPHGYVQGKLSDGVVSVRLVPASQKEYKTIRYPVSNYMSDEELADELHRIIAREGEKNIYSIYLVRPEKCEKTFHLKEALATYRIAALIGEVYQREDYDEYRKANRGNAFGRLLDKLDADSPIREDGAKLAVDLVIERSKIYTRSSRKMNDRLYEETIRVVLENLKQDMDKLRTSKDIQAYEQAKERLAESPDVLERLNEAWAMERKNKLELLTARNNQAQIVPRHRSKWIRTGIRAAIVPFVIFCIMALFLMPRAYVQMSGRMNGADVVRFLVTSVLAIVLCFVIGYVFARLIDQNKADGIRKERADAERLERELAAKGEQLHEVRTGYQLQDTKRREIQSDVNAREDLVAQTIYKLQVMEEAMRTLE